MYLSNTLFLEEEQLSTPVHKDVTDLNFDPSKQSMTQPEYTPSTSVDEVQTEPLFDSTYNVKCSNKTNESLAPDNSKMPFVSQNQSVNNSIPFNDNADDEEIPIISDNMG